MPYYQFEWHHAYSDEPISIYSEVDDDGWESRKVELFRDGSVGYADGARQRGTTGLAEVKFPSVEEIAVQPEFKPRLISRDEFEAVWKDALERP